MVNNAHFIIKFNYTICTADCLVLFSQGVQTVCKGTHSRFPQHDVYGRGRAVPAASAHCDAVACGGTSRRQTRWTMLCVHLPVVCDPRRPVVFPPTVYFGPCPWLGLEQVARLTQLRVLNLGHCVKITDAGLKSLAQLKQLTSLNLEDCENITNTGLQHLTYVTFVVT